MAETKKVRIMARVGDPSNGVILQPGTVVTLPEVWADRYVAAGSAELVERKLGQSESKPKAKKK